MPEDYVRPPIVATEAPRPGAGVWRFRLVFGLIVLVIAAGVFLLIRAIVSGPSEGNPGVLGPPATAPAHVADL